ncbi:MAG: dienelactone hydrolase family protein [Candidatus Eremiobacteraeota bacterium]|nr:dienelactone hydrolase family protein [Candidatus Eremiobacteraeota bacterium]
MPDLTDPQHATTSAFGRRTFVAIAAGAAALAARCGAANAQTGDFGKPHPPIVPEDDGTLVVSHPRVTSGERTIDAYLAVPRNATAPTPGIVVVQAIWGVDAQLRDVARRFAKQGYAAIAPNLYTGLGAPSGDGATDVAPYRDVAAKLVDATVDADIAAAADYLRSAPYGKGARIGVTGFCMGGGITLRQAVDNKTLAAAVVFYGKVRYGTDGNAGSITPIALAYADELTVPLAGSWGERDTSILAADVRALDAKLTELRRPHNVKIYPEAGLAFFDDTRSSYVPSAATDAWTRTLVWFGQHLGR